eukprot:snap_masked-scaffold_2-processed-gene-21.15-mRNA-1 protein AED:1.00 eAED:1.00 QI:0/-1/0/0/-1/1/1/0/240
MGNSPSSSPSTRAPTVSPTILGEYEPPAVPGENEGVVIEGKYVAIIILVICVTALTCIMVFKEWKEYKQSRKEKNAHKSTPYQTSKTDLEIESEFPQRSALISIPLVSPLLRGSYNSMPVDNKSYAAAPSVFGVRRQSIFKSSKNAAVSKEAYKNLNQESQSYVNAPPIFFTSRENVFDSSKSINVAEEGLSSFESSRNPKFVPNTGMKKAKLGVLAEIQNRLGESKKPTFKKKHYEIYE